MHYGSMGVISALDARRGFLMGQRVKLSFLDIQMANAAYKCNGLFKFKWKIKIKIKVILVFD